MAPIWAAQLNVSLAKLGPLLTREFTCVKNAALVLSLTKTVSPSKYNRYLGSECENCPVGTFNPLSGAQCQKCPDFTYQAGDRT
jgi:hypothetical protein